MKAKEISDNVKFIQDLYRTLTIKKNQNSLEAEELDTNFEKSRKDFENKRTLLNQEKERELSKENYVIDAVKSTVSDYKKVNFYLWAIFGLAILLLGLNFFNNGFNFGAFVKFLLVIITLSYFAGRSMSDHITSIGNLTRLNRCIETNPPFFYRLFGKPTLKDNVTNASQKYLSDTKKHYDKLIYDRETEINLKIQQLKTQKKENLERMNTEMNQIIQTSKSQLALAKDYLDHFPETSSSIHYLIQNNNQVKLSSKVFTSQFLYSHSETFSIANDEFLFPIYYEFGKSKNIHLDGFDRQKTKEFLKEVVFRRLIGTKLSKVKITMFDPVELGAFFSDFHNLHKDITDGFVYNTIDDLNNIIESTLRHIAMIVQKVLTNKYSSLDDFNEQNPELSEPYKILIFNDFPKSFDDYQIEKIKQIISSGPKCGIYTIIIGNTSIIEFEPIDTINTDFIQPIFNQVNLDNLIQTINKGIVDAGTIVVDLKTILADEQHWWTNDSSASIELPLGKKGKEIQSLKFDNKDDNQALMIGKPGSGKSNLLHVIILNAITKYGPNDLEIYLIDFKGGVEFMSYTEYNIPQLRTVALESDREFGLSVIDGVEKELLRRETLFRNNGVQNIEQFNQKNPENKVPRILFIVDEFQEFFKIDDELKEQVSLKYDTIIRKGRAFGINSLFSSQTLEGHSMPRATKELIDIRIAMMCGDNDVREIMDDKNLSAKDLSRPGEAIYNAENGKVIGNQRFQAVFVERSEITNIIKKISEKSTIGYMLKDRFIFRGDLLAKITKENHSSNNTEMLKFKALRLWIGEPVSMEQDYFIDLKQSSAQNLIAICANHEAASIYSSLVYSLSKQMNKVEKIYILNPLSDVDEGYEDFNGCYSSNGNVSSYSAAKLEDLFDEITELISERKESSGPFRSVVCFINSINKLPKFRSDNFVIEEKLIQALDEGPELGIHFIFHSDSLINFKRTHLDRILNTFNHRIAFNMSEDAYYSFIGSNQIKQLKANRMVYYSDEIGKYQIIKPYELIDNNQLL